MTCRRVVGFGKMSQRSQWLAIPAICVELLYLPSMQWLSFSPTVAKQRWSSRIKDHLSVQVWLDDGPPQHVCLKCKRKLQTLERDAEDSSEQQQQGCCLWQASCQT